MAEIDSWSKSTGISVTILSMTIRFVAGMSHLPPARVQFVSCAANTGRLGLQMIPQTGIAVPLRCRRESAKEATGRTRWLAN